MRKAGLDMSQELLEKDTKGFIAFFNQIKQQTSNAAQLLEGNKKLKNEAIVTLR